MNNQNHLECSKALTQTLVVDEFIMSYFPFEGLFRTRVADGNPGTGIFPGIRLFPGTLIPGNRARESREQNISVLKIGILFFLHKYNTLQSKSTNEPSFQFPRNVVSYQDNWILIIRHFIHVHCPLSFSTCLYSLIKKSLSNSSGILWCTQENWTISL